jgi:hypothetical protein
MEAIFLWSVRLFRPAWRCSLKNCTLHNYHCENSVSIYLLTELNPSWETANCGAIQELPSILWSQKVYHRVHKSPPLVPILSQIDPVHTFLSYLSKIYFNNCPPTYVLVFLVVSFLLAFPSISYTDFSSSSHLCYIPCPSVTQFTGQKIKHTSSPENVFIIVETCLMNLLTYGTEPFLRSCQFYSHSGNFQLF